MTVRKRPLPTDFALSNPSRPSTALRRSLVSSAYSSGFTTKTALSAHHSCVNALAISPDGRWLASGGDDMRVLLWDANDGGVEGSGLAGEPRGCYKGARSNIFSVAFSCDGKKLFSAGNDATILCFDLEASSSTFPAPLTDGVPPIDVWLDHDDSIMGLSCHPSNPSLFLSASSDGTLRLFDTRTQPGCVGILADHHSMDDVAFHPLTPDVFAYGGEDGHVGLVDARTAFGGARASGAAGRVNADASIVSEVAVMQFDAHLVRRPTSASAAVGVDKPLDSARPTVSSLTFSPGGSLLCATLSGHLPTLYELSSPSPLATFSSPSTQYLPTSEEARGRVTDAFPRAYRNTCTTKHGSFGGGVGAAPGRGLYYAAGSDDFKAYVWEVPPVEALREQRRTVEKEELRGIGYRSSLSKTHFTLPASISTPSAVLTGNRSIVNTALFHPSLPLIFASGVEKPIIRHSASSSPTTSLLPPHSTPTASSTATIPSAPATPPKTWHFHPRLPRSHLTHPGLSGPCDPALDPSLLPGETAAQRELRLRKEDVEVLEYFDGLVEMEGEEALWDEAGKRFGAGGGNSDEEESEDDDGLSREELRTLVEGLPAEEMRHLLRRVLPRGAGATVGGMGEAELREVWDGILAEGGDQEGEEEEEEAVRAEGEGGTTRRMLRAIYALEEELGTSSDDEGEEEEEDGEEESSDAEDENDAL
ncbi:hypothetical protein JCM6882_008122 [Rhodosporidiobolus microsporus]